MRDNHWGGQGTSGPIKDKCTDVREKIKEKVKNGQDTSRKTSGRWDWHGRKD